jgi:hypothetical protein
VTTTTLIVRVLTILQAATQPLTAREVYDALPSRHHAPSPLAVRDVLELLEAQGQIDKTRGAAGPYAYARPGYPWAQWPGRRLVGEPGPERRQHVPWATFSSRSAGGRS